MEIGLLVGIAAGLVVGSRMGMSRGIVSPTFVFSDGDVRLDVNGSQVPLRLAVDVFREGTAALVVHVEVRTYSNIVQWAPRLNPFDYQVSFRDEAGREMQRYWLPPRDSLMPKRSDFQQIPPGHAMAANYLVPTPSKHVEKSDRMQCKVEAQRYYLDDQRNGRLSRFALSSGWVTIPLL